MQMQVIRGVESRGFTSRYPKLRRLRAAAKLWASNRGRPGRRAAWQRRRAGEEAGRSQSASRARAAGVCGVPGCSLVGGGRLGSGPSRDVWVAVDALGEGSAARGHAAAVGSGALPGNSRHCAPPQRRRAEGAGPRGPGCGRGACGGPGPAEGSGSGSGPRSRSCSPPCAAEREPATLRRSDLRPAVGPLGVPAPAGSRVRRPAAACAPSGVTRRPGSRDPRPGAPRPGALGARQRNAAEAARPSRRSAGSCRCHRDDLRPRGVSGDAWPGRPSPWRPGRPAGRARGAFAGPSAGVHAGAPRSTRLRAAESVVPAPRWPPPPRHPSTRRWVQRRSDSAGASSWLAGHRTPARDSEDEPGGALSLPTSWRSPDRLLKFPRLQILQPQCWDDLRHYRQRSRRLILLVT
ncbi:unnamed protein product [Nyctereutes procyonoides]|uniref:(raccoon dog) hypothetical protein n=1 Tax=Nyctereutes procyonoides TaxID=34880 RepID=A0A811Z2Q7_NYCPR|nr:unnamed protein product [Nyctereutes procyonoides]